MSKDKRQSDCLFVPRSKIYESRLLTGEIVGDNVGLTVGLNVC